MVLKDKEGMLLAGGNQRRLNGQLTLDIAHGKLSFDKWRLGAKRESRVE